ncbi:hypothetical protein LY76DRAFT_355203 [Colletotrichum caudatum]|nr:hypothetical protein LY76DRAFT_355203 [Colletotrichum caudatum]
MNMLMNVWRRKKGGITEETRNWRKWVVFVVPGLELSFRQYCRKLSSLRLDGGYSLMGDCAPQFGIRLLQCHVLLSRAIPGHHDQSGANSRHIRPRGTRDMGTRGQKAQDARYSSRIFREPSARRYAAGGHGAAVDHGWLAFGLAVFSYGLGFFHL